MLLLLFIIWYVIGGLLPALFISKRKGIDLRLQGSGNPGARNAGRVLGKSAFVVVFVLDAIKGALPVLVCRSLGWSPTVQLLMLGAVMLGHCFPVVYRFRGGKGMATFLGGMVAFQPLILLPVVLVAAALYPMIRQKTKVSVLAMAAIIPVMFSWHGWMTSSATCCLIALLFVTHRSYLIRR